MFILFFCALCYHLLRKTKDYMVKIKGGYNYEN